MPVRGALPFESFKTKIDAEIKKANALLKKGTKLKDVYAAIMKDAGKPVGPSFKLPTAPKKPTGPVKIADHPEDMAHGPKNAKVTIYEFSDFQCPFCSKGADAMNQVKKEFGDKVRIVFKNLPLGFHQHAEVAARAAHAAGKQGKFWEMHDVLFKNQRSLGEECGTKVLKVGGEAESSSAAAATAPCNTAPIPSNSSANWPTARFALMFSSASDALLR